MTYGQRETRTRGQDGYESWLELLSTRSDARMLSIVPRVMACSIISTIPYVKYSYLWLSPLLSPPAYR